MDVSIVNVAASSSTYTMDSSTSDFIEVTLHVDDDSAEYLARQMLKYNIGGDTQEIEYSIHMHVGYQRVSYYDDCQNHPS